MIQHTKKSIESDSNDSNFLKKKMLMGLLVICLFSFIANAQTAEEISIINLIATPEKYQGREVIVAGYAIFGMEVAAVYLSKNDVSYGITKNSICLSGSNKYFERQYKAGALSDNEIKQLNNSYALIYGTFDSKSKGHAGMHSGCLKKITKIKSINELTP